MPSLAAPHLLVSKRVAKQLHLIMGECRAAQAEQAGGIRRHAGGGGLPQLRRQTAECRALLLLTGVIVLQQQLHACADGDLCAARASVRERKCACCSAAAAE